jgi:hypothetical protein
MTWQGEVILDANGFFWLGCRTVSRGSHRLVAAAAAQHRPIAARYDGTRRFLCPHVVGYNQSGDWRLFCYQYGGETKDGPLPIGGEGIWRCLSMIKLSIVEGWMLMVPGAPNPTLLSAA